MNDRAPRRPVRLRPGIRSSLLALPILVTTTILLPPPPAGGGDVAAPNVDEATWNDRLEEMRRADPDGARSAEARALLAGGAPPAIARICEAYLALGRGAADSAEVHFAHYLATASDPVPGALLIADEWERRRRGDLAAGVVRRTLERAPGEALLHARLAAMHLARGDTARAAAALEELARRQGSLVPPARELAHLYGCHDRLGDAVALLYRLAPRVDTPSEYATVHCELGCALLLLGDTLQARASFAEAWQHGDAALTRAILDLPSGPAGPEARAWLPRAGEVAARVLKGWTFGSAAQVRARLQGMRDRGETPILRRDPIGK